MTYTYDALGWLTDVTDNTNSELIFNYGYNSLGNLTSKNGLSFEYYGPVVHAPSQIADLSYSYDENGNRQQRQGNGNTLTYTYDPENRLTQVSTNVAPQVTYSYDGEGRRVQRYTADGESSFVNAAYELVQSNGWSQPATVFGETGNDQDSPDMTSDAAGTLYLVWAEDPDSDDLNEIYFAKRIPGGNWNTPSLVRSGTKHGDNPVVAVPSNGTEVYVAWQETIQSNYSHEIHGGSLGADTLVATLPWNTSDPYQLTITAGPSGAHLAWVSYHDDIDLAVVHVAHALAGGGFVEEYQTTASIGGDQYAPALAADSQGNVYLAYLEGGNLYMVRRSSSGGWGTPELISNDSATSPSLAVDSQDNLLVVWYGHIGKRFADTGTWEFLDYNYQLEDIAALALRDDTLHWLWIEDCDCSDLGLHSNTGTIVNRGGDIHHSTSTNLALGPDGALVAMWQAHRVDSEGREGPSRIFVATYNPGTDVIKHYYAGGQRLATRINDDLYYILGDHLGSATLVTDAQGNEVGHVTYEPFGQIAENTLPPHLLDRLFTGQRYESTIGLYDYNARFYDPEVGQFIQPDSLVAEPGNPIAWNRYAYVYNSPVNHTDPSGHIIDTVFDALDLATNAGNCLGDSDALSCYMVPVSLAAMLIPGATRGGGFADDIFPANPSTVIDLGSGGTKHFPLAGLSELGQQFPRATVIGIDNLDVSEARSLAKAISDPKTAEFAFNFTFKSGFQSDLSSVVNDLPSNVTFVIGDFKVIASESADLVTAFAPYPHMIHPTIAEATRIVRPKGTIIIATADVTGKWINEVSGYFNSNLFQVDVFRNVPLSKLPQNSYLRQASNPINIFKAVRR